MLKQVQHDTVFSIFFNENEVTHCCFEHFRMKIASLTVVFPFFRVKMPSLNSDFGSPYARRARLTDEVDKRTA